MWLTLRRKTVFVNICSILLVDQKQLFKQIQIFLLVCPYSNLLRKTNFLSISVIHSEIVIFWIKREVFSELARKCFKTTEKQSLAVCSSFWGEKQFLLIFVPFYCFEQKGLLTTNPNFLLDFPLFILVWKNKLSEYFWASFWNSPSVAIVLLLLQPHLSNICEMHGIILCIYIFFLKFSVWKHCCLDGRLSIWLLRGLWPKNPESL